jgi:hypothetical protein
MSGTQIWIGRNPCLRSRLRCALTLSRDDLDRVRPPTSTPRLVTCNLSQLPNNIQPPCKPRRSCLSTLSLSSARVREPRRLNLGCPAKPGALLPKSSKSSARTDQLHRHSISGICDHTHHTLCADQDWEADAVLQAGQSCSGAKVRKSNPDIGVCFAGIEDQHAWK